MMSPVSFGPRPPLSRWVWAVSAIVVLLQLAAAGFGLFRDEFYYLMGADRLAWGYVDHPPLSIAALAAWKSVFGSSLVALRVPPALLGGLSAAGAALLAREMRGRAGAQALAAATVGLMPSALGLCSYYSMNAFDMAFWVGAVWIACRLLGGGGKGWWWALGAAVGLGALNKYSMVFLGAGLAVGFASSPLRRDLMSRPALGAAALAVLIVLPHLAWQMREGWPTLEFMHNVMEHKNVALGPAGFWGEQLLHTHPLYVPVWLAGLVGLLAMRRLRPWRVLGVAFVVVALWLTLRNAKPYYLTPAFPMLLAAGAVMIESWLADRRYAGAAAAVLAALAVAAGLALAPLATPLLPVEDYVAYEQILGMRPKDMEDQETGLLPQHFADRLGWEELARTVAEVHAALPEVERGRCLIVAGNYGECGAINYWGPALGLPTAVCGHNSCFAWWPETGEWDVVLAVGGAREQYNSTFASVAFGGLRRADLAMPYEREIPVWICRGWRVPPADYRSSRRFAI